MRFQYSMHDDVITPNLGYYRTDMTISSTALNQSKLLNYFQKIIKQFIVVLLKLIPFNHSTKMSDCLSHPS